MNKSLAFKNKLYLFFSLLISFFIFLYLGYFLINGILSFYKIKNNQLVFQNHLLKLEKQRGFYSNLKYTNFSKKVKKVRKDLLSILWKLKLNKKTIVGVGCPGRSITLLAYCNITEQIIDYIAEQSSSLKLNLFTPSTHIKILDEKKMIKEQPDYVLILSWHYGKSVIKNLKKKGYRGKFIIPLPIPKIIS